MVIAFRNVPNGEPLSLASFSRSNPVKIVKLPLQNKVGDEDHNKMLFKRRIKTGKTWMKYLPGVFNDELISKLFFEIDPSTAKRAILKHQTNCLRLGAHDSFVLKEFAGMSDNSYIKINRALFYFTGAWFLAPITHVRKIRIDTNEKKLHKHI